MALIGLSSRLMVILLPLALCVAAAQGLKGTAASGNSTPEVPDEIGVPPGYELKIAVAAQGHQYYRYNGTSWVNFSAKAKLWNQEGEEIGRHFYLPHKDAHGGQPSWETLPSEGVPYSLVTGVAVATTIVQEESIPWVLLKATDSQGNKNYFGEVVYVQRINTMAGRAPSSISGVHKGQVWKTKYTADYAFYGRK